MKRRTFCISTLAAAAASVPATRLLAAQGDLPALTGEGRQILLTAKDVQDFGAGLRGQILLPNGAGYEEARKVWNGAFDRRPALIVRCAGAADVTRAVNFGRAHQLLVAVRGGGHSLSGQSSCEGGMVIDLSQMRSVRVDPTTRRAYAGPGALLGDLDREADAFGLVTPAGTVSHTGIAGLTLGGGYGRLARKYGLTCDNLHAADVVTAEGKLLRASAQENADLLWGLRGGGGNFGVVTSFEYRMHQANTMMVGGALMFPAAQAREILKFWSEFAPTAPDELYADAVLTRGPGGARVLLFDVCYSGSQQDAERVLRPLRAIAKPIVDAVRPISYAALQASTDGSNPHGRKYYIKSGFVNRIEPAVVDILLSAAESSPASFTAIFVHQGGAIARVQPTATAVSYRSHLHSVVVSATWENSADTDRNVEWARNVWRKVEPHTNGFYVNTTNADDSERRVRETYGVNYDRLATLKRKYDPANLFRMNANIKPV